MFNKVEVVMKTITIAKAFDKRASLRNPMVKKFHTAIEELLKVQGKKLESFEIRDGVVTAEVPDEAMDSVVEFTKRMRGAQIETASSAAELFLVEYNRTKQE